MNTTEFFKIAARAGFQDLALDDSDPNTLSFEAHGYKCAFFLVLDKDEVTSAQLFVGFRGVDVNAGKVNEWNGQNRFVKLYTPESGLVAVEMDIVTIDITRNALEFALDIWQAQLLRVYEFL